MFYRDEEDVGRAHLIAERKLGNRGRYAPKTMNGITNAYVGTREFGTIWYGDIDNINDLSTTLKAIAREIGQRVYLMSNPFNFRNSIMTSD